MRVQVIAASFLKIRIVEQGNSDNNTIAIVRSSENSLQIGPQWKIWSTARGLGGAPSPRVQRVARQPVLPEAENCRRSACRSLALVTVSANHLEPAAHQRPLLRLSVTLDAHPTACTPVPGPYDQRKYNFHSFSSPLQARRQFQQQRSTLLSLEQVRGKRRANQPVSALLQGSLVLDLGSAINCTALPEYRR